MGSRERKRAERRKRKRRSADRGDGNGTRTAEGSAATATAGRAESFEERMARRTEERNAAARAKLEPLESGERPGAVTVAAVVSAVIALIFTVSAALAIAGMDAGGREIKPVPIVIFAIVSWLMAAGMWRARYWAVLGFQVVLVLVLLAGALGLVQVSTVPEAVATVALLAASGTLFYFMIRAMARIQMPERPGSR